MDITLNSDQVHTLVRLLGAGKGAIEYSLEHDDIRGVFRTMAKNMVEEYDAIIKEIVAQHNKNVVEL